MSSIIVTLEQQKDIASAIGYINGAIVGFEADCKHKQVAIQALYDAVSKLEPIIYTGVKNVTTK